MERLKQKKPSNECSGANGFVLFQPFMEGKNIVTTERKEYLKSVACDYNVDEMIVFSLAEVLGESEDYDGLINEIEDLELYEQYPEWD